jgi:hypothetical protein
MFWNHTLDQQVLAWQLNHWKWLDAQLATYFTPERIHLVTPTSTDFPVKWAATEDTAQQVFLCVQRHMGVESWPCTLESFEQADDVVKRHAPPLSRPQESAGAAGLFHIPEPGKVFVRYRVTQLSDPMSLIATLAHELCHYVLATVKDEPPAGWTEHEPITDLTACYLGFGIFMANSVFRFSQWQDNTHQGWSAQRQGYLSQEEMSLALTIFCRIKGIPLANVLPHLATDPKHYVKSYAKALDKMKWSVEPSPRPYGSPGAGSPSGQA